MATEEHLDSFEQPYTYPTSAAVLNVKFSTSTNTDLDGEWAYRLRAEVVEATNIDPAVFVYQSVPRTPGESPDRDAYVTVATILHMQELPADVSTPESGYFCRKASVDILVQTTKELEFHRAELQRRLLALVESVESLAAVQVTEFVRYTFETDEEV
jgi:hypothetical protein